MRKMCVSVFSFKNYLPQNARWVLVSTEALYRGANEESTHFRNPIYASVLF